MEHGGILEIDLQAGEERIEHGAVLQRTRQAHHEGRVGAFADVGHHGLHGEAVQIGRHGDRREGDVVGFHGQVGPVEAVQAQGGIAVQGEGLHVVQVQDVVARIEVHLDAVLHMLADAAAVVQVAEAAVEFTAVRGQQTGNADIDRCQEGDGALRSR